MYLKNDNTAIRMYQQHTQGKVQTDLVSKDHRWNKGVDTCIITITFVFINN